MARRRKQQGSLGETIGLLLLAIPVMIWNYIKAHPIEGALIISGIILFICWAIGAKKRRRAAFLKEFYDRSRRLRELNVDDYIDVELTDEITEAAKIGKAVSVGQVNVSFKDLARAYDDVLSSIGIAHGNENIIALQDKGEAITFKYGIKALCDPVKIITEGELKSGYSFYIFPETILVFFEGPEKTVFIAAVDPKALSFSCEDVTIHKQVVVQEKTQNSIRYYDIKS